MNQHLLLIDASGFAFRSYYGFNPRYREDGLPTGATLGFMAMIWHVLGAAEADKPTHGACVFDAPGKTFRHKLYPAYKANRDPSRRVELDEQFPYMRHAAEALGFHSVELEGFEADDVLATLAQLAKESGFRTTIVSSDKDLGQTIEDGVIEVVDPMAHVRVLEADVVAKFGVPPTLVPDVQALAGDAVDGIPGIPGCGLKRAAGLVRRFGSLSGVLAHADECRWPQLRSELKRKAKLARLYLKLTTLRRDAPLTVDVASLTLSPPMRSHVMEMLKLLEAAPQMEVLFTQDRRMVRVVERVNDPLAWWLRELRKPGQVIPDAPQAGFYQRRLVQGGPWVPARVWLEPETGLDGKHTGRDLLRCEVGGRPRDPLSEWGRLSMHPIKQSDFEHKIAVADWAKHHAPDEPEAQPTKKINWNRVDL